MRAPHTAWAASLVLAAAIAVAVGGGCASNKVSLRSVPKSPLADELGLTSFSGPKPSPRTVQLLRVCNLGDELGGDYSVLLRKLQAINDREPSADVTYAMSELAFLGAKKTERFNKHSALSLYGAAVLHAYDYLFDPRFAATRNPYDPQYRGACDLYNGALESALRIACANKELVPGVTKTIQTASGPWDITIVLQGSRWQPKDFERFEFVSDYDLKGIKNLYQTHGLGVPLIAIRHDYKDNEPAGAKYYPPGLSFPVTALMRPSSRIDPATGQAAAHNQCVLELCDPLERNETVVAGWRVPLESDLTTPLAYFLSRPEVNVDNLVSAVGLLKPDVLVERLRPGRADPVMGLYMIQPYEPGKIPVLLVHGLWSTPMTWMEMFNDLRSQPAIRQRYQFWFYLYPTGQPFWLSAAQLRRDLAQVRQTLDPNHQEPALDQMVLVGHSMGGLVSELQTLESGDAYWRLVSPTPFGQIKADATARRKLLEAFYFEPNPSIRRVITLGTPHRGSPYSNQTTQWLLDRLIRLPERLWASQQKLYRDNPDAFPDKSLAKVDTSIDSLSPRSPIFPVMLASRRPSWVKYHNVVGVLPKDSWLAKLSDIGDGVVSRDSAHVDGEASEIEVAADHSSIHSHPAAVLEVRRILLEHLDDMDRSIESVARLPATTE
jgi:pimeloyl-ACP methyl ester carboxylesterase